MLQNMRSGWLYAFFIAFLLMGGVSLVLMDYGSYYDRPVSSNDIAKAGNTTLGTRQFDQTLKRAIQPQNITAEQAYQMGMVDQLLRMQVIESLLAQEADHLGIVVSDDQVIEQIRTQLGPLMSKDQNASDMVRNFLRAQGLTEKEFIAQSRKQTANALLRGAIAESVVAPTQVQAADLARAAGETRTADVIEISFANAKGIKEPDVKTLQAFYDDQKAGLMLPEKRSFIVATLPLDRIKKNNDVSEQAIKDVYEQVKGDQYTSTETRMLEQAVLKDAATAQKLITALKGGKSMQAAIAELKQPANAYQGAQGFERAGMPDEIGDLAFTAQKNDIIGPVQTALGSHVLILKDIKAPHVKPLKDVRDQIKNDLLADRHNEQYENILNDIDDLAGRGDDIKAIAKTHDMTVVEIGGVTQNDPLPTFKDNADDIRQEAFTLGKNEISPAGRFKDNTIYIVGVKEVEPAHPKAFNDVKDTLQKQWVALERAKASLLTAQKIVEDVKAKKTTLAQAAKSNNLTLTSLKDIKRGTSQKSLDAGAVEKLFSLEKNDVAYLPKKESVLILSPTAISIPAKADAKTVAANGQAESVIVLYFNHLRDKLGVSINDDLLRQLYAPKKDDAS